MIGRPGPAPQLKRPEGGTAPAAAEGTDEEGMAVFLRVRDEIRDRLPPELRARG